MNRTQVAGVNPKEGTQARNGRKKVSMVSVVIGLARPAAVRDAVSSARKESSVTTWRQRRRDTVRFCRCDQQQPPQTDGIGFLQGGELSH